LCLSKHSALQNVWGNGEVAPHSLGEHTPAALSLAIAKESWM